MDPKKCGGRGSIENIQCWVWKLIKFELMIVGVVVVLHLIIMLLFDARSIPPTPPGGWKSCPERPDVIEPKEPNKAGPGDQ